jgi:phenylalanyl-tRNA synthetase beta chain
VRDVEALSASLGWGQVEVLPVAHPALHPGQAGRVLCAGEELGVLGALHPALARRLDIDRPLFLFDLGFPQRRHVAAPQYQPISRFPAVRRDLNVVVAEDTPASACLAAAREGGGELLRDLELIDVYRGQGIDSGKKSLTLGLLFQVASSTLTDDEVEAAVNNVLAALRGRVGGVLRK